MIVVKGNTGYDPSAAAMTEQKLYQLFERLGIRLYAFHYPNEYWAVTEEKSFAANEPALKLFSDKHHATFHISVGKCIPLYQLADSYASCMTVLNSLSENDCAYAVFDQLTLEMILSSLTPTDRDA